MNAKKVLGTLLLKPAFTQRNITSILLVAALLRGLHPNGREDQHKAS